MIHIKNKKNKIVQAKCDEMDNKMDKEPGVFTAEELREIARNFKVSRSSVGHTDERERYKNKYSRISMEARIICERNKE